MLKIQQAPINLTLQKAVEKYLDSDTANERNTTGSTMLSVLKPMIGTDQISQFLDPLIDQLEKTNTQDDNKTAKARTLSLLGLLYRFKLDFAKAMLYLEQASELGEANALFIRAFIYEKGLLGERDLKKSLEYYGQAAKLNHANAVNNLVFILCDKEQYILYHEQEPQIERKIKSLIFEAALQGNAQAEEQFNSLKKQECLILTGFSRGFRKSTVSQNKNLIERQEGFDIVLYDKYSANYLTETHTLLFPLAFSKLNPKAQEELLQLIKQDGQEIYREQINKYSQTFRQISPMEAVKIQIEFDNNKDRMLQEIVDKHCKNICEDKMDDANRNVGENIFSLFNQTQTISSNVVPEEVKTTSLTQ